MSIRIELLKEPKLQFGGYFEHEDAKTGLAEFGPFGKNVSGLHPSDIKVGFVGTRETISGAREWMEQCALPIESENVQPIGARAKTRPGDLFTDVDFQENRRNRLEKILNPDFVGFNHESQFQCRFQMNERWNRYIQPRQLDAVLDIDNKESRIRELVTLVGSSVENLATTDPAPDIIVLALTPEIYQRAHAFRISGNFYLNFRRAIKAQSMKWGIPLQLLRRSTAMGKGRDLQEKATRAWNFCTAQYYKAEGVPWRPTTLNSDTCFIGISFYVAQDVNDRLTMRASVAQAFDYLGQGLVLRGEPFEWDEERHGRTPHLTETAAHALIRDTLNEYVNVTGRPPRRVVIHKRSRFWGEEHGDYDELAGIYQGIQDVFPRCESDLVTLDQAGVRLFREGSYPPLRGTYFCVEDSHHFLYTMGFIPFLETYPGSYVPEPWQIVEHHGGSSPKDLFYEIMALTKMNMNNCAFADGTPITLSFSEKIGEIMKHIPEDGMVQPRYRFYM